MRRCVLVLTLSFLITHCVSSYAQPTVGPYGGQVAPGQTISPPMPTTADFINFTLNADGNTYSNSCFQLIGFGGDMLSINVDESNQTIDIATSGMPPFACALVYLPVTGLRGSVGPLSAGDWTINSLFGETLSFTVVPEPSSALLAVLTTGLLFGYRSRGFRRSVG